MGVKAAAQIAQSQLDAIALVREIVKAEGIPCDLNGVPTYLTSSERGLAAEARAYHVDGNKAEQVSDPTTSKHWLYSTSTLQV